MVYTIIRVNSAAQGGADVADQAETPEDAVRRAKNVKGNHVHIRDGSSGALYDIDAFCREYMIAV